MNRILLFAVLILASVKLSAQTDDVKQVSSISNVPERTDETSNKKVSIKLYPNPSYGKICVRAITFEPLHFYIFDLDGTLVYQTVLNNKDKKNIENLKKGTYLYDVFERDESIEEGKIIVK